MKPSFLCALPAVLFLAACGDDAGRATPAGPPPRDPIHLVVSGTDREMGLQHGKALAKEIREEVGPRLKARFRAVAKDDADSQFLETACRTYTGMTKPLLAPETREELTGIAEGSGVPEDDILLLEVMRDGLRFHVDAPPLLEAALASDPGVDQQNTFEYYPTVVIAAWDGAGGIDLSGHALLLERRPKVGASSLVVTWPGGLGAWAGTSSKGVHFAHGEVAWDKASLSLGGVPFGIAVATALRTAADPDELIRLTAARNGNRILAAGVEGRRLALVAHAGPTSDEKIDRRAWVLFPAGLGGSDPRLRSMNERLGAYPARPDYSQIEALVVSGRSSQAAAVIRVWDPGIRWHRAVRADGTDVSPPIDFPFPSRK